VLPLYLSVLVGEWALVWYVARGLRGRRVVSIADLVAERWRRPSEVVVDIAIAAIVWALWLAVQVAVPGKGGAGALLPRGAAEVVVFMALAVSAGICEEIAFRGYLQTQLTALTSSITTGVILQAAVFAVGHLYEGIGPVVRIAVYGGLFGAVAEWRRSLRPGIIAHAWSDLFVLFFR